jgi:hypothetical protein
MAAIQGPSLCHFWYKRDPSPSHLIIYLFATVMLLKFHPTSLALAHQATHSLSLESFLSFLE